ncbi:hypothetical protein COW09_00745 [bacterium (Candidatus Moisslbacteria) CG12_big_fil_rev_8_21_14_0_65_36_11]|nr:methyltransferase domain-containing protein [Candidatus Kuenenbacteria bacterium]OIP76593.1 MAG: hypothetical protein AUK09_01400 [Parcubacteria group bacterium CG2_30_36_38]PIV46029.1 MAG: hypothetical protein COS23_01315 [bacterium (Candidatus Moisslbacteria) CG02_land_8_20_14_3_00_36_53]PIW68000.1 MAG: hypothetical protein COW09_00745 [bacterium (Candidatus Moisslbacteria) CG12_big_fil_rev_8_21_14_0_65_36_11]PIZ90397.1 MAG: hypothetical protein COX87_00690 [bacterium (Candidatus Moisslbac
MKAETLKIPGGKELIDVVKVFEALGIAEKMKIADLGCGRRGHFSLQAAKLVGTKGIVYAIDILQPALKSVESLASLFGINNLKTIWADLEVPGGMNLETESIDLVLLNNILFQTKKHEIILAEAKRILRRGGKLLVTEWEKTGAPFGPEPEKRVDKEKVKKIAESVGLVFEKEIKPGPYHYSLIFLKK